MAYDGPTTQGCVKGLAGLLFSLGGILAMAKRDFGIGQSQPGVRASRRGR